jgi:hypothetical protein
MTDSNMLDLYELMLHARAAIGIRPLLYISSPTELECSVLMLLNEPPELTLAGRASAPATVIGQRIRTS